MKSTSAFALFSGAFFLIMGAGSAVAQEAPDQPSVAFNPAPINTSMEESSQGSHPPELPDKVTTENLDKHVINPLTLPGEDFIAPIWPSTAMEHITLESPATAPKNKVMISVNSAFSKDHGHDFSFELPIHFDFGVSDNFDIGVGVSAFNWEGSETGVGDGSLSFKWNFLKESDQQMAVILNFDAPMGSVAFSGGGIQPKLLLVYSHALTDDWSFLLNTGVKRAMDTYSHDAWGKFYYGLGVSHRLKGGQSFSLEGGASGPSNYDEKFHKIEATASYSFPIAKEQTFSVYFGKGFCGTGLKWKGGFGWSRYL